MRLFPTRRYSLCMSQALGFLLIALIDLAGVEEEITHQAEHCASVLNQFTVSLSL